jgi:hypothetical protein
VALVDDYTWNRRHQPHPSGVVGREERLPARPPPHRSLARRTLIILPLRNGQSRHASIEFVEVVHCRHVLTSTLSYSICCEIGE